MIELCKVAYYHGNGKIHLALLVCYACWDAYMHICQSHFTNWPYELILQLENDYFDARQRESLIIVHIVLIYVALKIYWHFVVSKWNFLKFFFYTSYSSLRLVMRISGEIWHLNFTPIDIYFRGVINRTNQYDQNPVRHYTYSLSNAYLVQQKIFLWHFFFEKKKKKERKGKAEQANRDQETEAQSGETSKREVKKKKKKKGQQKRKKKPESVVFNFGIENPSSFLSFFFFFCASQWFFELCQKSQKLIAHKRAALRSSSE